ncbi:hypothetical protein LY78DRAFT_102695 [Colletotrichum sublineola]|nr:hypothetical protein LY78DRAFT_102695 [Colletotrichum sublineola]
MDGVRRCNPVQVEGRMLAVTKENARVRVPSRFGTRKAGSLPGRMRGGQGKTTGGGESRQEEASVRRMAWRWSWHWTSQRAWVERDDTRRGRFGFLACSASDTGLFPSATSSVQAHPLLGIRAPRRLGLSRRTSSAVVHLTFLSLQPPDLS